MSEDFRNSQLIDWDGKCMRCDSECTGHTMSWFNADWICMECDKKEWSHPDYKFVKHVEFLYITKRRDYNYPGPGWPGEDGRLSEELKQALQEQLGFEWSEERDEAISS